MVDDDLDGMKVLRVFNNNIVLAKGGKQDDEVILTGRGLGFQARPGDSIDPAKVVRVFAPTDGRDPDHIAQMLAGIPADTIRIVSESLAPSGLAALADDSPSLVVALADHIDGAIRRGNKGVSVEYPLQGEVTNLYPGEYAQAQAFVQAVNQRLDRPLPDSEAVAVALHVVNAGFSSGDLTYTYQMTGVIEQVLGIIEKRFDITLDRRSVNVARFITHMRYLFVRIYEGKQLTKEPSPVVEAIRESFPDALQCAFECAAVIELRLDADLSDDEVSYMTLHIARVSTDAREE